MQMEAQQVGADVPGDLHMSVSFGRFDKDSLSWEKWSSFSPNKYLEEVEKCATPGSVARKAAYFEAHYKRVAARKAELLLLASDPNGSPPEEEEEEEHDMITLEKERLSFEVVLGESTDGPLDRSGDRKGGTGDGHVREDLKDEVVVVVEEEEGEDNDEPEQRQVSRSEAAVRDLTSPASVGIENDGMSSEMSARIREDAESWRKPRKADSHHKEKIMEKAKKKPAPAIIKSPQVFSSTPRRTSRPTAISPAPPSVTKSSRKPGVDVPNKSNKGGPAKVSPNHTLRPASSSNPRSSDPAAVPVPRRSLIMERMGDKDIIKRAFKTFQNHVGQSKSLHGERSSTQKAAPSAATGDAGSTAIRTENTGRRAGAAIKKSNEVLPPQYVSRSSERLEKRIQSNISRKPAQKSAIKATEKPQLQSKMTDQGEIDVKRVTQSNGFKATPAPTSYRGQNRSLSNQRKMVKKQET